MPVVAHANDRNGIIVMTVLFTILITSAVGLRFYARHMTRAGYSWDDWTALAALLFTLGLNGIFLGATIEGAITGHSPVEDGWPVPIPLEIVAQKYKYAFQITEKFCFGLIKISLLLLWKRLFGSSKRFRTLCWVMITLTVLWTLAFALTTVFQCGLRWELNWSHIGVFLTQCIESLDVLTVFATTDILSDLIIIAMPVPLIWRLHLPTRKKIALNSVFLIGFFTIGAGIARTYMYLVTSYDKESNPDFIADFTLCILWSEIEANVAMLVSCLPVLSPVIGKFSNWLNSSLRSTPLGKWLPLPTPTQKHSHATSEDLELSVSSKLRKKQLSRLSSDKQMLWQEGQGIVTTAGYSNTGEMPNSDRRILARTDISTTYEARDSDSL
ncbi:putative plasma membrane protein Pth11-like protein [Rosellinia necatrix]|uniref:Putative plasma membrane protein Pth11-like protein n=1 Tax=Rosellinia necatrix TaxID=77044 RepID=A0A1S7UNI7_ROSNE|nr:putative plasma membrane protein Pth11-like protein [Rosellinia necatrix]